MLISICLHALSYDACVSKKPVIETNKPELLYSP